MNKLKEAAMMVVNVADEHGMFRPEILAAIESLRHALNEPEPNIVLAALEDMMSIVDDSRGVAGYHLNGEIAEWHEFDAVRTARAAIAREVGRE